LQNPSDIDFFAGNFELQFHPILFDNNDGESL
jgi:hypothetical protein